MKESINWHSMTMQIVIMKHLTDHTVGEGSRNVRINNLTFMNGADCDKEVTNWFHSKWRPNTVRIDNLALKIVQTVIRKHFTDYTVSEDLIMYESTIWHSDSANCNKEVLNWIHSKWNPKIDGMQWKQLIYTHEQCKVK